MLQPAFGEGAARMFGARVLRHSSDARRGDMLSLTEPGWRDLDRWFGVDGASYFLAARR